MFVCMSFMPDQFFEFVFSITGIVPKLPLGTFVVGTL